MLKFMPRQKMFGDNGKNRLFSLVGLLIIGIVASSCEDLQDVLKKIENNISKESTFQAPPGEEATQFLAVTTAPLQGDTTTLLEALNVGITEEGTQALGLDGDGEGLLEESETLQVSDSAAALLEKIRAAKLKLNPDGFREDSEDIFTKSVNFEFNAKKDRSQETVTMAESEFTIPILDKMPVRSQGSRGTCSAFAGIGQLEGYILQNFGVESIDLSEQRFYAMSKPEHWADGGPAESGGSNAGTGFSSSAQIKTDYDPGYPEPSSYAIGSSYNIPLESSCPYVNKIDTNDIQAPKTKESGCASGVAKVTSFEAWHHGYDNFTIDTAQDIYDFLKQHKYPVLVSSKLSENWEENDGIITWAETQSAGSTDHASGHAYLIVGARKLDESKYPGEGGMCFIIKNSWGKGWGVNGLSCMTLTWWNKHRYADGYPVLKAAIFDNGTAATTVAESDKKPDTIVEPDEKTKTIEDDPTTGGGVQATTNGSTSESSKVRPKGKITFGLLNRLLLADDFQYGRLLNNEDQFSKVLYRIDGNVFTMRGILSDGVTQTHNLSLLINESNQLYTNFKGKGSVTVGHVDTAKGIITLCSQEYSEKCHLNFLKDSSELLVGISEAEFLSDASEGPYDWNYLGVSGKGIEVSFPDGFSNKLDVRITDGGSVTNPLRFRYSILEGDITYQGRIIGNYQDGELCSGSFRKVCKVVRTKEKFLVLFKS